MDLESELDQLFQAPLAAFVARRNELGQRLNSAGRAEEVAQVRALQRPTPAAWAVNQLAYRAREVLAALLEASHRVRAAQESGQDAATVLRASGERAEARRRAEHEARGFLGDSNRKASAAVERRIAALLDAYAAGKLPSEPGRLLRDVEAIGFEAFDEVLPRRIKPDRADAETGAKEIGRTKKRQPRSELEALVDAAARRARDLESDSRRATARVDRATRDVAEAEGRLTEARAELAAAQAESSRATAALDEAKRVVALARKELGELHR